MNVVYKYRLFPHMDPDAQGPQKDRSVIANVTVPINAQELSVAEQEGSIFVWLVCDPDRNAVDYKYRIVGTGWEIDREWLDVSKFIGTVHSRDGFVWHIFRELRK